MNGAGFIACEGPKRLVVLVGEEVAEAMGEDGGYYDAERRE